jgi:hypothetical protein
MSDTSCRENETFYVQHFFFPENRAVYEIIWKNSVEQWVTIWGKLILCWIPKATHTRGVGNVTAFPPQHWLHERTSMLRYTVLFLFSPQEPKKYSPIPKLRP